MADIIASLRVALGLDSAQFSAGNKKVRAEAKSTAASVTKSYGAMRAGVAGFLGSLSIGAIIAAGKAALDYAGSLGEVSQQLGVTTRDLQVFRFAASQLGVSQSELDGGLQRLTITLGQVAAGAKRPAEALKAIGLNAREVAAMNTGDAFRAIADGLQKIGDRSQRAAVEVALFGKSGAKLDNLLAGGSAALNELAAAADKLGIVLSDEQIQKADETADKLGALQTVLKARIAGVVADNADSILGLANALVRLIGTLGTALRAYQAFAAGMEIIGGKLQALDPTNTAANQAKGRIRVVAAEMQLRDLQRQQAGGSSAAERAARFRQGLGLGAPAPAPSGNDIGKFMAGGGGSNKSSRDDAERKRQEALRRANDILQEQIRTDQDILAAKRDLSTDYVEQHDLSIQMLDLERKAYAAQLQYEVAAGDKSKAEAASLLLKYDEADSIRRQAKVAEMQAKGAEDSARLDQVTFDLQRDALESQLQLADTAKDRRDLELRLLDLGYRQERARLEAVIADEQSSFAAKEEARRRLAGLNATYANDRQGVMNSTAGAWEQFQKDLSPGRLEEQWESLKVNGILGAVDALAEFDGSMKSLLDSGLNLLRNFISEFLKLQLLKGLSSLIGGGADAGGIPGFGAITGFATGGSFNILGNHGRDRNMLALNGVPIAKVSHGERISVGNDAERGGGMGPVSIHVNGPMSDRDARRTGMQVASAYQAEIARSKAKGF